MVHLLPKKCFWLIKRSIYIIGFSGTYSTFLMLLMVKSNFQLSLLASTWYFRMGNDWQPLSFCQKENHRPQMASPVLKPMTLIAALNFTRKIILINQSEIFWSTPRRSFVTWATKFPLVRRGNLHDKVLAIPFPQKRWCPGIKIIHSFLFSNSFLAPPLLL